MQTESEKIIHDLNNKLNIILGNSELLLNSESISPQILHRLNNINQSCSIACDLVRSLYNLLKQQHASVKTTSAP